MLVVSSQDHKSNNQSQVDQCALTGTAVFVCCIVVIATEFFYFSLESSIYLMYLECHIQRSISLCCRVSLKIINCMYFLYKPLLNLLVNSYVWVNFEPLGFDLLCWDIPYYWSSRLCKSCKIIEISCWRTLAMGKSL